MLRALTHRLARPHGVVADLDIAVEEDIGVGAADKLEHLYPEQGLGSLAIPQHAQGLLVGQQRAAAKETRTGSEETVRPGATTERKKTKNLSSEGRRHCVNTV